MIVLALTATAVEAQSLGSVAARRESQPRKDGSAPRAYTNGDLAPIEAAQAPASAAEEPPDQTAATPAPRTPDFVDEIDPVTGKVNKLSTVKPPQKRDEQYWRTMSKDIRGNLNRTNARLAEQQTRLAGLGGGPDTPVKAREREVITKTIADLQKTADAQSLELTRFLTRAGMARIPDEWYQE